MKKKIKVKIYQNIMKRKHVHKIRKYMYKKNFTKENFQIRYKIFRRKYSIQLDINKEIRK